MARTSGYHHIAMGVADFDASVRFYTETLGFSPGPAWGSDQERAMMLDAGGGSYLEIFERPDQANSADTQGGPLLHFALRVDNCAEVLEAVRASGAEITIEMKDVDIPSTPVYPVRIAFFEGPDGETVELFEER